MEKTICGAKTRKGTPCQRKPQSNGRCNSHGGKSTGPKDREKKSEQMRGNKNALTTGAYETISYETLSDNEKELLGKIPEDLYKNARGRYSILEIRTLRLMQRYADELKKEKPSFNLIARIEEALGRNDSRAVELIREMRELSANHKEDDNGSMSQLNIILGQMRDIRNPQ